MAHLASRRRGVEGHLVVSVVVTAFESPSTELTELRTSSAAHSIHIFPPNNDKNQSLIDKSSQVHVRQTCFYFEKYQKENEINCGTF